MAKKRSRASRISDGGRQKRNVAHEEVRQARFARRKEAGKEYHYKKNPYDKKTQYEQWHDEDLKRREKAQSSKLPYARLQSIFAKLENQLAKDALIAKEREEKKGKRK